MAGHRFPTNLQFVNKIKMPDGREKDLWATTSPDGPVLVEVTWPVPKEKQ